MGIYTGRTSPTYYTASRSSNSCPKPYWDYVPCAHELLHIWPCKIKLHLQGVKKNKGIPDLDTTNLQYEGSCLPTGAAPKAMPPFLFCWPTTSEADVGGMAVEVEPSTNIPFHFVAMWQMAAAGQSDKMAYEMEVCMKKRCRIEFTEFTHWHSPILA